MRSEPIDLARDIRDRVSELTGRELPQPRTLSGLNTSLQRKLPDRLSRNLAGCSGAVRRAERCMNKGREAEAVAYLCEALAMLTPELVEGPPDLALQIRDRVSELTGHSLPVPRGASGLYHSLKAIPLKDLDEPLAATIKACRALLRPPQNIPSAHDFAPPLEEVLALLTPARSAAG